MSWHRGSHHHHHHHHHRRRVRRSPWQGEIKSQEEIRELNRRIVEAEKREFEAFDEQFDDLIEDYYPPQNHPPKKTS